eukprot:499903_1
MMSYCSLVLWMFVTYCMLTISAEGYAKICNITAKEYGAKGDGKTDNTIAIQSAINDCANASNITNKTSLVLLPPYYLNNAPTVYMSGALWMQSNIEFYLDKYVTLLGIPCTNESSNNISYPWIYTRYNGIMMYRPAGLINGGICKSIQYNHSAIGDQCIQWKKLENVSISGNGMIDGNGHSGWHYKPFLENSPCLMDLLWINNLNIFNITLINSPAWTIHPCFVSNIIIHNIIISTSGKNNDGIDVDSCKNVLIQNSILSTSDDNIAIKSGKNSDGRAVNISTNNVTVRNITFLNGNGIAIGSEMSGNVTNVIFHNLFAFGTQTGPRIKSAKCRGGMIENITFSNIVLEKVQYGITLDAQRNDCGNEKDVFPIIRNISYTNITGTATDFAGEWLCLKQLPCYQIDLNDINITCNTGFSCQYVHGVSVDVQPKSCIDPN